MVTEYDNYVEGFLASGGSLSVSASADDEGNSDSSIGESSDFKMYICYLFEDADSAKAIFDQQVEDMFSMYEEQSYKIEETDNGSILTFEEEGVTAVMEVNGNLFTLVETIQG